jgi:hypothetical protein
MMKYLRAIRKLIEWDPMTRFEVMKHLSKIVFPAYRFKWPQMDWWNNLEFTHYLERFSEQNGMNTDRRWMLNQLLRLTYQVPGDTAECGVYQGAASYLICQFNAEILDNERHHFMFDSFEGLSKPSANDSLYWSKGDLSAPEEAVRNALSDFPNITLFKGWIPTRFKEVENKQFSFVHIDVDLYEPTLESMAFFYPRMSPGGIILCDDYGFSTCPGATRAVDKILQDKPEKMISLCSGGGFMIKGCPTQG